jgi:PAS domain S-box-containing protein
MTSYQGNSLVLVVDDDMRSRIILREALEQAGFDVEEAENGEAAVQIIERQMPDLILLDVVMPIMDGFETCLAVRHMAGGENLPIVLMTGLDDTDSINRAFEIGATSFVTKPINYLLLTYRLKYLLRAEATARQLRDSENRLAKAQCLARLGHWEWDPQAQQIQVSSTLGEILGKPDDTRAMRFREFLDVVDPRDRMRLRNTIIRALKNRRGYRADHRIVRVDGSERVVYQEAELVLGENGKILKILGIAQDITDQRRSEEKIRYLAYFDAVTGLPNRVLLKQIFNHTMSVAKRHNRSFAFLFVDLDHFKNINDTLGHDTGDELLRQVATKLRTCLRSSDRATRSEQEEEALPSGVFGGDTVTRLGGDEFLILLTEIRVPENAALVAKRILEKLAEPIVVSDKKVTIGASIGISVYPLDGSDFETLLKKADTAMYHAKETGRNCAKYFVSRLNQQTVMRFNLDAEIRRALENDEFVLHYQPKMDIVGNRVAGVEALIRWQHPEKGLIPPGEFIPIAEELGLIVQVGDWVLARAIAQAADWQKRGFPDLKVSINISPVQFARSPLLETITQLVCATKVDPRKLDIEITENVLLEDSESTMEILRKIGEMGIAISIDDFGTGYSSLAYLNVLPVSHLKIDRRFIGGLDVHPGNATIVRALIGLARNFDLVSIAEGVETTEQLDFLRANGCAQVQGFLYSRPMLPADLERWITKKLASPQAA